MTTDYLQPSQPDILEVISNLSSDEVFTPPKVANAVLDLLPPEVWTDPTLRWLDPGCKTGIFPREITKRLMVGLAAAIPDEDKRLNHILTEMVFAIAITDLTGMMSRRTLYCSKNASSDFSAVRFSTKSGNIWHERVEHNFDDKGRCPECSGTKQQLEVAGRDNYAYGFIHSAGRSSIEKEMGMKFDVIVGNPPYQMEDGGNAASAMPLYNVFVEMAKELQPRYLTMIIPSRWMASGRGLDDFRARMLTDRNIRKLVDYPNASDLFPGVEIKGGVCYFLWDRDNPGSCASTMVVGQETYGPAERALDEFDVFVRDERALSILHKVLNKKEAAMLEITSPERPFGGQLPSNFAGYRKNNVKQATDLLLHIIVGSQRTTKWVSPDYVTKNLGLVSKWKVFVPMAYGAGEGFPHQIIGQPLIGAKEAVCTQSYICVGPFGSKEAAVRAEAYLRTRFARFLISLRKISQHAGRSTYAWVPQQDWAKDWTDRDLYKKYGLTMDEQDFIEAMIKEMPA